MRKAELRMNEKEKYEKIKYLVDHNGNKNRIAVELGISKRQVNRLIIKYKEKGIYGFVHGNRLKKPVNTLNKSLSEDIILLYTTKYQDCNFKHFRDLLEERENINVSYTFIYNTLMRVGITSPKIHKATKRRLLKEKAANENKTKSQQEIELIVNHQIGFEDSHPRQERKKYFGEEIQMDGSIHLWFGSIKVCLHLAIDNATGNIVGGFFDKQETLFGYYNVFKQILEKYGIPYKFKTDNRTVFNYESSKRKTPEKDVLTQFGYACKILGTSIETTSVSQAKGMIERANGTFQGRLVQELRIEGINTIEEANKYLIETFIPNFNKHFGLDIAKFTSVFETTPSAEKINYTLAVLTPRKIDNGNAIKFKNKYYQPYDSQNQLICFKSKTECLVIEAFDKSLFVSIDEKVYCLNELQKNSKYSLEFNEEKIETKEKKKYIPSMTHPWKASYFKKQQQRAHRLGIYA